MKTIAVENLNIAILGAGAMGSLFGGYLSRRNKVYLIDTNEHIVSQINSKGLFVTNPEGTKEQYTVAAIHDVSSLGEFVADLVIVFVKGMHSESAIKAALPIISENTYVLSLQNGIGHEIVLSKFVKPEQILVGTTQHNCATLVPGSVKHGGNGITRIGRVSGTTNDIEPLAINFTLAGIKTEVADNYKVQVWEKIFTNISASALTGVLQVPLGFIVANKSAWDLCQLLVYEAITVAKADGVTFDYQTEIEKVKKVCENSPQGLTSIYSDLANGRKSEVDTISGGVVKLAQKYQIDVPYHEFLVKIIHALEGKIKT